MEHPEVICTSSRKTINAIIPKQSNEPEESQEEVCYIIYINMKSIQVEIVGEIHHTLPGESRLSQKFIEEAIKSVETADIQIEEQESSSDSFSILSDSNIFL